MRLATCVLIPAVLFCSASFAAPAVQPDRVVVPQCSETRVDVVINDFEHPALQPLTLVSVSQGSHGSASIEGMGTIRYVSGDRSGTDTLIYQVHNRVGEVAPGMLTVVVSDESRCS